MRKLCSFVFILLSYQVHGTDLLANKMNEIKMPEYSWQEKKDVLENVILLVEQANVNRRIKMEKYGKGIDPVPRLKALRSQLSKVSSYEFQKQISRIIQSQRDLHLKYRLPSPYACYSARLPFWFDMYFKRAEEGGLKPVIAVKRKFGRPEVLALLNENEKAGLEKVEVGHLLVQYGEHDLRGHLAKALEPFYNRGQGSNSHAGLLRAVRSLTLIRFGSYVFEFDDPIENPRQVVKLTFADFEGREYNVSLPWVVDSSSDCLNPNGDKPKSSESHLTSLDRAQVAPDLIPDEYESFIENSSLELLNLPHLNEGDYGFRWGLIQHFNANYGYIRIPSFDPTSKIFPWPDPDNDGRGPTSEDLILELKDILEVMQSKHAVRGLVIDVRNNGGGSLLFSESMAQFFSKNPIFPTKYRMLNSDFNRKLLIEEDPEKQSIDKVFEKVLLDAKPGAVYTKAVPFIGDRAKSYANRYGQVFYKPVVVLTNSFCYSACDKFTAMMKDTQSAKIWSEGRRTGGGGANVVGSHFFQNVIESLEISEKLPLTPFPNGQGLSVPWRQIIRTGINSGKRLEEDGVIADRSFLPTYSDLLNQKFLPIDELVEHFEVENWMQGLEFSVSFPQDLFTVEPTEKFVSVPVNVEGVGHLRVVQEPFFQFSGTELIENPVVFNIALGGGFISELKIPLPEKSGSPWLQYRVTGKQSSQTLFNKVIWVERPPKTFGL